MVKGNKCVFVQCHWSLQSRIDLPIEHVIQFFSSTKHVRDPFGCKCWSCRIITVI